MQRSRVWVLIGAFVLALVASSQAESLELDSPWTAEASFGEVTAAVPAGAELAALYVGARRVAVRSVSGRRVTFRLTGAPGLHDLRVRFERDGRLVRRV